MEEKEKLQLLLSLAHRARGDEPEDLPFGINGADGEFRDLSHVPGHGRFFLRVRDTGCDMKEMLRAVSAPTFQDDQGRRQVTLRPFQLLAYMLRNKLLLGCRLPLKAKNEQGADELRVFDMDATKGDIESHVKRLDENVDPGTASVLYAMVDAHYGLTGGTKVEEVLEDGGNLPPPLESTEETS